MLFIINKTKLYGFRNIRIQKTRVDKKIQFNIFFKLEYYKGNLLFVLKSKEFEKPNEGTDNQRILFTESVVATIKPYSEISTSTFIQNLSKMHNSNANTIVITKICNF